MEIIDVVEVPGARFSLGIDGIIRFCVAPGGPPDAEQAQLHTRTVLEMGGGVPRPLLLDLRDVGRPPSAAARRHYATFQPSDAISAVAFLIHSPVGRVVATFLNAVRVKKWPTQVFAREDAAVAWLAGYR